MRQIESMLDRIYEKNADSGNYIIDVALQKYIDIFNDWDHAPYKRKDINPGLIGFLEDSIDDIPMKYAVDISFYLSSETKNEERERVITDWFKTFFTFYIEIEREKIRLMIRTAAVYMVVSAALLTASYFGILYKAGVVTYTVNEIIVVGGWLFLWEAISRLIFDRKVITKLIKNYRRFINAPITFRYRSADTP